MASWEQGRDEVDALLLRQRIERVEPNRPLADALLAQAEQHLAAAPLVSQIDPAGAFQLAYDSARKALTAILAVQGLRAKGAGGHAVLYEVTRAQLHPPLGPVLKEFDWMRRLRNDTEYPDGERQTADANDVAEALPAARRIVDAARTVLDELPLY